MHTQCWWPVPQQLTHPGGTSQLRELRETQRADALVLFTLPWENSIVSIALKILITHLKSRSQYCDSRAPGPLRHQVPGPPPAGAPAAAWRATAPCRPGPSSTRRSPAGAEPRRAFKRVKCSILYVLRITIRARVFRGLFKITLHSYIWEMMF